MKKILGIVFVFMMGVMPVGVVNAMDGGSLVGYGGVGGDSLVQFGEIDSNSLMKLGGVGIVADGETQCAAPFLGFYPWYYGLPVDGKCRIKEPTDDGSGKGLATFIWTIILNVIADLTLAIGYIALGTIIWGGYYMITSNGDPGKVTKARKILVAGISGSLIGIFASVIIHAIISVL